MGLSPSLFHAFWTLEIRLVERVDIDVLFVVAGAIEGFE